jgi:hypothetical protein
MAVCASFRRHLDLGLDDLGDSHLVEQLVADLQDRAQRTVGDLLDDFVIGVELYFFVRHNRASASARGEQPNRAILDREGGRLAESLPRK